MTKKHSKSSPKKKLLGAFTIPELLTIVAVIVILLSITLVALAPGRAKSRDAKRVNEVNAIRKAIQMYYLEHNQYPAQDDTWCSVESDCTNLINDIASYLPEIPGDPLYGKGKEESTERIYSYRYVTTNSGSEYRIHTDLERGGYYEVYSLFGKEITYVPPDGEPPSPPVNCCVDISAAAFKFSPPATFMQVPIISQINSTYYLVVHARGGGGYAVVLEVDSGDYSISTPSGFFNFGSLDTPEEQKGISKIDEFHHLIVFNNDALILGVDPDNNYNISISSDPSDIFGFVRSGNAIDPTVYKIDSIANLSHHLIVYGRGGADTGKAVVIEVDSSNWSIIFSSDDFIFGNGISDTIHNPVISRVNSDHYLITQERGFFGDEIGSVVLKVDPTNNYFISKAGEEFGFDPGGNNYPYPAVSKISDTHYLTAYNDGSVVLKVDSSNYSIDKAGGDLDFGNFCTWDCGPAISKIDDDYHLVVWGEGGPGKSVVLKVDPDNVSMPGENFEFDDKCKTLDIIQIDPDHYLVVYESDTITGWAVVLELIECP